MAQSPTFPSRGPYDARRKLPQSPYPTRPGDPGPAEHARSWLAHVEAGRIGGGVR